MCGPHAMWRALRDQPRAGPSMEALSITGEGVHGLMPCAQRWVDRPAAGPGYPGSLAMWLCVPRLCGRWSGGAQQEAGCFPVRPDQHQPGDIRPQPTLARRCELTSTRWLTLSAALGCTIRTVRPSLPAGHALLSLHSALCWAGALCPAQCLVRPPDCMSCHALGPVSSAPARNRNTCLDLGAVVITSQPH